MANATETGFETVESRAAFGRRLGVSGQRVGQLIKRGEVLTDENGQVRVEPSLETLRRAGKLPDEVPAHEESLPEPEEGESAEQPETREGLRSLLDRLDLMSKAEAEQVKENYLAMQRRLEYDKAAGEVVPVDEAAQKVAEEYAAVRSKLMALPTELAPTIAQESGGDANQIRERLAEGITRALEELTEDEPNTSG